jgi:prophage regulatory protein
MMHLFHRMKPKYVSVPDAAYLKLDAVLAVFPVTPSDWHAGVKRGDYPAPVTIAPRVKAYRAQEVRKFLDHHSAGKPHRPHKSGKLTFEQIARQWMAKATDELTPGPLHDIDRRFCTYVFPYIGLLPIDAIQPQRVISVVQPADRVSTHGIASHLKGHIAAVFRFAVVGGVTDRNPATSFFARDIITIPPDGRHHAAF